MKVRSLNLVSGAKGLSLDRLQTDAEEAALVRAVAGGDEPAFASRYDKYSSILFGLLLRILHSRAEAEDVLQEVFLQVWQRAHSFDAARGRAFTWLVTLARSRAIDRLRSLGSRERAAQRSAEAAPPESEPAEWADAGAVRAERADAVREALAELPEEERQVLGVVYLERMWQSGVETAQEQQ